MKAYLAQNCFSSGVKTVLKLNVQKILKRSFLARVPATALSGTVLQLGLNQGSATLFSVIFILAEFLFY